MAVWLYILQFRFTPPIRAIMASSTTFEITTTQQLTTAQKAQVSGGDFEIISEEQIE